MERSHKCSTQFQGHRWTKIWSSKEWHKHNLHRLQTYYFTSSHLPKAIYGGTTTFGTTQAKSLANISQITWEPYWCIFAVMRSLELTNSKIGHWQEGHICVSLVLLVIVFENIVSRLNQHISIFHSYCTCWFTKWPFFCYVRCVFGIICCLVEAVSQLEKQSVTVFLVTIEILI